MKVESEVLQSRPRITLTLDRDSVCAADDCEMHEISVETYSYLDPVVLAEELSSDYLPLVAGFGHWWECILNGTTVAKVLPNGKAEKVAELRYMDENSVYFKYYSAAF